MTKYIQCVQNENKNVTPQDTIYAIKNAGFDEIIINVHHFAEQIIDFLQANNNFGITIHISDETNKLLDTGGGIKKAAPFLNEPCLIHNVDILSNTDLKALFDYHLKSGNDSTLLVSPRKTVRYLLFNEENRLCGWINKDSLQTKPEGFIYQPDIQKEYAFSGIHVISPNLFQEMDDKWTGKFSIMDFYLQTCKDMQIGGYAKEDLRLIDIGKPETLAQAADFIHQTH